METGNIKQALSEIKQMMNMPMKCFTPSASQRPSSGSAGDENVDPQAGGDKENEGKENNGPPMSSPADGDSIQEGDLPGQICRVLGKSKFTCNIADDIRYSYRPCLKGRSLCLTHIHHLHTLYMYEYKHMFLNATQKSF